MRNKAIVRSAVVGVLLALAGLSVVVLARRRSSSAGSDADGVHAASSTLEAGRSAPSVVLDEPPPPTDAWSPGWQRRYRINVTDTTTFDVAHPEQSFSVITTARLSLTAIEVDPRQIVLAGQLSDVSLNVTSDGDLARQAEQDLARDLARPFLLSLTERGTLRSIHAAREIDAFADAFLHALAGTLQFTGPPGPGAARQWQVEETDQHGRYLARYRAVSSREVERTKSGYLTLALATALRGQNGDVSHEGRGKTVFTRSAKGGCLHLQAEDQLSVTAGGTTMRAEARVAFALEDEEEVPLMTFDRAAFVEESPTATRAVVKTPAQRLADKRKLAGNATFSELADELRKVPSSNSAARWAVTRRMSALFDTSPGSVALAVKMLHEKMAPDDADMLLAALSDAASPEAQTGLVRLGVDRAGDARTRDAAITHLGLQDNPSADSLKALRVLAADTADPDISASATLALGGAIRHLDGSNGEATGAAKDSVRAWSDRATSNAPSEDRQLALSALGNAGSDDGLPALRQALNDPDAGVRAAAAASLRFVAGAEADRLVANTLLGDVDPAVRSAALVAVRYRALNETLLAACSRAVTTDQDEQIRLSVVSILSTHLTASPTIAGLLEQVAASDASPNVRQAALRAVHPDQVPRKAA